MKTAQKIEKKFEQMQIGLLEFVVILTIARESVYAKEILEKLSKTRFKTTEGTLYPLLSKLKKAQFLKQKWEETNSGPPRKYYYLSPLGEKHLAEMKTYWKNLTETISLFQSPLENPNRGTQN